MHIKWTLPEETFELTSGSQKYEGKRMSLGLFTLVPVDKAGDAWAGSMLWGTDGVITIHRSGRYSMHICPNRYGYEMKTPALRWAIEKVPRKGNGSEKIGERPLDRLLIGRSPVQPSVFKDGCIGTWNRSDSTDGVDIHLAAILTTATHLFCAQMLTHVAGMPDPERDVRCRNFNRDTDEFFLRLPILGRHCGKLPWKRIGDDFQIDVWDVVEDGRQNRGKITFEKMEVQLELNPVDKIILQPVLIEKETHFKISPNLGESVTIYLKQDGDSWRIYNPHSMGNSLKFMQIKPNDTEARHSQPKIGCFWDSMPYLEYAGLLMVTTHVLDKELRYILAMARTGREAQKDTETGYSCAKF